MKKKIIVAALGLPVSEDGQKVLLTRRHAPKHPSFHDKWQLAGGGLEYGESIEDAVVREIWEELHVKCKIIFPYAIIKHNVWSSKNADDDGASHVLLVTYLVDIKDATPDLSFDPDWETSAWDWFSLDQVRKLDTLPGTLPIVEEAFQLLAKHAII